MPYTDNKGVKVYYESWGSGGVPIVFLHPWSTNGYIWYFQLYHFARNNTCVVIDHRGHGRSRHACGWLFDPGARERRRRRDGCREDRQGGHRWELDRRDDGDAIVPRPPRARAGPCDSEQ